MKNNLTNIKSDNINKIDWKLLQNEMKNKFGSEIYDSWLKKIDLVDEFKNYVLLSVSTRFIRDWITSHYLDKIIFFLNQENSQIKRVKINIDNSLTANMLNIDKVSSDVKKTNIYSSSHQAFQMIGH